MTETKKIYIISYYNLKEKLAGGLRANELFIFLKQKQVDVEIVTRNSSEGYETIVKDFKISKNIRKFLHLIFPDSSVTWVLKLYYFFKNKKNIVLIITSPPHGLVYLSKLLRKNKSIKCIQDFRDPFTLNAHPQKKIFLRKYFNKRIEDYMTKNIDYIIFNTDEHKRIFLDEYKNNFKHKVIRNGYIYEDFDNRIATKSLVYFGGHYGGKVVNVLLKFMKNLNELSKNQYKMDIYGEFHKDYDANNAVFNYCGMKNRSELVELLKDYKIGIVCYTEYFHGRGVATKFYEMLGLGILPYCINPSNDLKQLIKELGYGSYCYEDNFDQIDASFFENFTPIKFNEEMKMNIRRHSRDYQNNLFLEVLNDL